LSGLVDGGIEVKAMNSRGRMEEAEEEMTPPESNHPSDALTRRNSMLKPCSVVPSPGLLHPLLRGEKALEERERALLVDASIGLAAGTCT